MSILNITEKIFGNFGKHQKFFNPPLPEGQNKYFLHF